ncbi:hypothetical protein GCM10020229_25570 [Kitasatospora albolonga]|uniref:DUF6236 family protein n=1 Tax=Kitasatospora albolonga TaxID=68173 RepID=UPI0031EAD139
MVHHASHTPKLARVVPEDFPIADPDSVKALRSELDFIVDQKPHRAAAAIAPAFIQAIRDYQHVLPHHYRAAAGRPFTRLRINTQPTAPGEPLRDQPLAGLYRAEVDPALTQILEDADLAQVAARDLAGDRTQEWLGVDPALAWVYKCALTEELARQTGYIPTTDQVSAHTAAGDWTTENIAAALLGHPVATQETDIAVKVGQMAVQIILPAGLRHVPIQKIIDLRIRYEAEFTAFAEAVDRTVSDLGEATASVTDRSAFERHLQLAFDKNIAQPLAALRAAMVGLDLKVFTSALGFQAPALTSVVGGLWGGVTPVAVTGMAVLGVTVRQAASELRSERMAGSATGFLLRAERHLKPATLVRRIGRTAHRAFGTGI